MKILVAGWDSGGGVEVVQTVVRRAVARGHQVRVLGTEECGTGSNRPARISAPTGTPRTTTPSAETDLVREWEARTPMGSSPGSGTG